MVIDMKFKLVKGVPVLMAYMPKSFTVEHEIDKEGYIRFDLRNFAWKQIEVPTEEDAHAGNN
jgi:hypothetical protein